MYNFFEYLYYRIYKCQLYWFGEANNPEFTAVAGVTTLQYFSTLTIIIIIEILTNSDIFFIIFPSKINALIYGFFLMIINYFLFMRKGKYLLIAKKYKKKSKDYNKRKKLLIRFYIIGTIVLFPLTLIIQSILKGV